MSQKFQLNPHAVQVVGVYPTKLYIQSRTIGTTESEEHKKYKIRVRNTEYDNNSKMITVGIVFSVGIDSDGKELEDCPYNMIIELEADFHINEKEFPTDKINHWAEHNAPIVLMPYLREHAYSLTSKCGHKPFIIPLVIVPTILNEKKEDK